MNEPMPREPMFAKRTEEPPWSSEAQACRYAAWSAGLSASLAVILMITLQIEASYGACAISSLPVLM